MKWPALKIETEAGEEEAVAPLVLSASRVTDIPAFHGEWFMQRLRAGYCRRVNPFNRGQESLISFARCRLIVFWSKNPAPFMRHIDELEERGLSFYFQFTLNDYEREKLEPRLPPLEQRLRTFMDLSERIGRERVIWRFDPVLLGDGLEAEDIIGRLEAIGRKLNGHTDKLVFSFVDMYKKTKERLKKIDPGFRAPERGDMLRIAGGIAAINREWPRPLALSTCAEEIELAAMGISRNQCVDPALIRRLCGNDAGISEFYAPRPEGAALKNSGLRARCACAPSRDIGAYNTCPHFCAYCYANHSAPRPGAGDFQAFSRKYMDSGSRPSRRP
ncbi:MAG: DUF1848 domain-containing protein [Deltaproteobacteria bacterium]|jgi:hypothetical protein|nr:DUF1848 domain-containing protein [Deltaproteobacteria bacterium]